MKNNRDVPNKEKKNGNKKKDTGRSPHHSVALISPLSKQSVCLQHVPGTLELGSLPTTQKKHFLRGGSQSSPQQTINA